MDYKVFGKPNMLVTSMIKKKHKALFRFDANGEYIILEDNKLIYKNKKLKNILKKFKYEEIVVEEIQEVIEEEVQLPVRICKVCQKEFNTIGAHMNHCKTCKE